jgi:hypothetical protein
MEIEKESHLEKEPKPIAHVMFGSPGHEKEYVLNIYPGKYSMAEEIPYGWENRLEKLLGKGWSVMNRGARIEIMPPDLKRTAETDAKVTEAIKSIIGNDYELIGI